MAKAEFGQELSKFEADVYELRAQGLTWEGIAKALKYRGTVKSLIAAVARAVTKGKPKVAFRHDGVSADLAMPEVAAEAVVGGFGEGGFDRGMFLEKCELAGIPPRMAVALASRINSGYGAVKREIKRLKKEEMIAMLEEKIAMAGEALDDVVLAGASAKDIAYVLSILIDRHQLLNDKPTAIFDVHQSMELHQLLRAAQLEAARRGITVDAPVLIEDHGADGRQGG